MDPLAHAKRVAAEFKKRLAREGEILANPVIENMGNSPFVSEGFKDKDAPGFPPKKEPEEEPRAEPQKVIPGAK